jgi:hypothetical protein
MAGAFLSRPAWAQKDSSAAAIPGIAGLSAAMLAAERIVNEPHRLTIYLDGKGERVTANASYFRRIEVYFRDSASGTVRVYYPSGKLYGITPYAHMRSGLRHGIETIWRENGKLLTRTEFVRGLAQEIVTYHPNGQVASRIAKGPQGLITEAFDSLGRPGYYAVPAATSTKDGKRVYGAPVWIRDKGTPTRMRARVAQ